VRRGRQECLTCRPLEAGRRLHSGTRNDDMEEEENGHVVCPPMSCPEACQEFLWCFPLYDAEATPTSPSRPTPPASFAFLLFFFMPSSSPFFAFFFARCRTPGHAPPKSYNQH